MASALRDRLRANMLGHTERAFLSLPARPGTILDVGCGTGVPTVRLAELSGGMVVGLDTDFDALQVLRRRARLAGFGRGIQVCLGSVDRVPFPDRSFDVVWCEGALYVLGFQESIGVWRRVLRPGGVLVAHDEAGDVERKRAEAVASGFTVLSTFGVSENEWWTGYYRPASEEENLEDSFQDELRRFDAEPQRFRSAFFLLQVPAGSGDAPAPPTTAPAAPVGTDTRAAS